MKIKRRGRKKCKEIKLMEMKRKSEEAGEKEREKGEL